MKNGITLLLSAATAVVETPKTSPPTGIPLFLLDDKYGHRWVEENKGWLESYPGVFNALCSLDSPLRPRAPSQTSESASHRGEEDLKRDLSSPDEQDTYPSDLFHTIRFSFAYECERGKPWYECRPPFPSPWPKFHAALQQLQACPAALQDLRLLNVHLSSPPLDSVRTGPFPQDLPDLIADLLPAIPNLRSLTWDTPARLKPADLGESARTCPKDMLVAQNNTCIDDIILRQEPIKLPSSLVNLALPGGRRIEWLPGFEQQRQRPNQSESFSYGSFKLELGKLRKRPFEKIEDRGSEMEESVRRVLGTSNLEEATLASLEVDCGQKVWMYCTADDLKATLSPNVKVAGLRIEGKLESMDFYERMRWNSTNKMPEEKETRILRGVLDVIFNLHYPGTIKRLELPWAMDLGLRLDNSPICGNFYDGPEGCEFYRSEVRENLEATETAGRAVMKAMPWLEELYIGYRRPFIVRSDGDDGKDGEAPPVLVWPWTGRLDEYIAGLECF